MANNTLCIIILVSTCLLNEIVSRCSFTQDCDGSEDKCFPKKVDTEPAILEYDDIACPEFKGKPVCCNAPQDKILKGNFKQLDSLFGKKTGGCDICAINLKRLWCRHTCGPDQAEHLTVKNPETFVFDGSPKKLLPMTMKLNSSSNCSLFKSCKKTKYASMVSAMSSAIGFTSFQGAQAYIRQPVFIYFEYPEEGGFTIDFENCDYDNKNKDTLHGFPYGGNCACSSCESLCTYNPYFASVGALNGINPLRIVYVYAFIICITVLICLVKDYLENKKAFNARNMATHSANNKV